MRKRTKKRGGKHFGFCGILEERGAKRGHTEERRVKEVGNELNSGKKGVVGWRA